LHLYIDPFFPDNFTKKFIKRETKKKESIEEDIQNSIEGLYSYLTAPNIRHKVSPIKSRFNFEGQTPYFFEHKIF
jgi:hypothetical protein